MGWGIPQFRNLRRICERSWRFEKSFSLLTVISRVSRKSSVIRMLLFHDLTKPFTIYRSSAGSGKTRTLAKEYLKLALRHRADYFKHILAVTFTNKATQEMKDRILAYLDDFAHEKSTELSAELKKELNLDDAT